MRQQLFIRRAHKQHPGDLRDAYCICPLVLIFNLHTSNKSCLLNIKLFVDSSIDRDLIANIFDKCLRISDSYGAEIWSRNCLVAARQMSGSVGCHLTKQAI